MPTYPLYKTVAFPGRPGLTTVGYLLAGGARITAGVAEVLDGSGRSTAIYGATIAVPAGYQGPILWDSGEATAAYAGDEINPTVDENTDAKISAVTSQINALQASVNLLLVPSSPDKCLVRGYLINARGEPAAGSTISFRIKGGVPVGASDEQVVAWALTVDEITTDTGYFEAELVKSSVLVAAGATTDQAKYLVLCKDAGILSSPITVPDAPNAWLKPLLAAG